MDLKINNTQSFSSRNKIIRNADDIARKARKEYPKFSNSLMEGMNSLSNGKFRLLHINISSYVGAVRHMQICAFKQGRSFEDKLMAIIGPIKKYKIGNCSEAGEISTIVAKINGLENAQTRHLLTADGQSYDHIITYIPDKKPYIIDSWLGFADYVPNAIKRYKTEFRHYFDFDKLGTEKMIFAEIPSGHSLIDFTNQKFTQENIETVKKCYPEMLLSNKNTP